MPQTDLSERLRLVTELAGAFDRHASPEELLDGLGRLEAELQPTIHRVIPRHPPRRVAIAMVLAVHSQPHLSSTYGDLERGGTREVHEPSLSPTTGALVLSNELLERALSVSQWEIDDLREEVDRRAGRDLKQARALQWIWAHFGLDGGASPWALLRVLLPGASARVGELDLLRRGSQLYAVVGGPVPPLHTLFLPWCGNPESQRTLPLTTFSSRYVDKGLRRAVARGIGADEAEMDSLLDHMVSLIPRDDAARFLERDQWRSRGLGTLTALGVPYTGASWLTGDARDAEMTWKRWLAVEDGELQVKEDARILFDTLASARVQEMVRAIYAAMLAGLGPSAGPTLDAADLPLFHVFGHIAKVLAPIVDWARRPDVHHQIAAASSVKLETVAERLLLLAEEWEDQLQATWLALPTEQRPYTVGSLVLQHLVVLSSSLRRLAWEPADPRWDHRQMMILFAAHYLAEARLERLWLRGLSDCALDDARPVPPPEDVVGTWFWGCWTRLLDALDSDPMTTLSNLEAL